MIAEVGDGDRVLDMGTGSGVNAILAAPCCGPWFSVEAIDPAEFVKEGIVETYWAFRAVRS